MTEWKEHLRGPEGPLFYLRAQRLGLLQTLVNEFSSIADFSEIVTERK